MMGMDMDGHGSSMGSCNMTMSWNWDTVGSCFLSSGWQITNAAMFAASCLGAAGLAILLEATRRMGRDFDALVLRRLLVVESQRKVAGGKTKATALQQVIRAVIYAAVAGIAYILMLLAMSFNGYIIFSIIIGTGIGKFFCDWLEVGSDPVPVVPPSYCVTSCCG